MINKLAVGLAGMIFVAGAHEVDVGHPSFGIVLWIIAYAYLDLLLRKA